MIFMKQLGAGALVIIVAIAAWFYVSSFSQWGIKVSCTNKSIIGFGKTRPPLAQIVQPVSCESIVKATTGGNILCEEKITITTGDIDVSPCKKLEDYVGKEIIIEAVFFNKDGSLLGEDKQTLTFSP